MPIRVQRQRTRGWKMPDNTIYVGRPSEWGNPYHGDSETYNKAYCVKLFDEYIQRPEQEALRSKIKLELKGRNLACWCRLDEPCHAETLLTIANS